MRHVRPSDTDAFRRIVYTHHNGVSINCAAMPFKPVNIKVSTQDGGLALYNGWISDRANRLSRHPTLAFSPIRQSTRKRKLIGTAYASRISSGNGKLGVGSK